MKKNDEKKKPFLPSFITSNIRILIKGHLPKTNHQFVLRVLQQVLEKTEATGAMNDIDSKISLGTNVIYYATKRLEQLKAAGSKIDKNHKDYKEGKKCAKQVLKREEMRGNIIPWCQFAAFEIEVTGVKTTLKDIYSQVSPQFLFFW